MDENPAIKEDALKVLAKLATLRQGQESIANENVIMFLLRATEDIPQVPSLLLSPPPSLVLLFFFVAHNLRK